MATCWAWSWLPSSSCATWCASAASDPADPARKRPAMNFRPRRRDEPEINLIPFIDVLLVVLIFLMLYTTYSKFTDRKSTRLNSSHLVISYAVFCLKKKKNATAIYIRESSPTSFHTTLYTHYVR